MAEANFLQMEVNSFQTVFENQKTASLGLRKEPIAVRKKRLKRLREWILANEQRIISAVQKDLGKPVEEVRLSEIRPVLAEIRKILGNLKAWAGSHYVETPISYWGTRSYIIYEPKGVTLIMAPWNFPFNLLLTPLASSLAAGNTVFLKPSEKAPFTAGLIAQMASEIFDPGEVFVVTGDASVAKELLQLPFDHIFFTGSPGVGKQVMKSAADHLSGITLELGGKSPAIVDSSGSLRDAAEKLVWGKFFNSGQTCIAPDYILCHYSVKDELASYLKDFIGRIFGGEGSTIKESSDYGRLVDTNHASRLAGFLRDALQKGATIIAGGDMDEAEKFMAPTILDNVSMDSLLMQEEIFGPILPLIPFHHLNEVIDLINSKPKPLALYLFSSDKKNMEFILRSTSSGTVVLNDCVLQFSHPDLPFGGINNSGLGKSHGFYGFQQFSNEKPVLKQRTGLTATKLVYPPYRGFVKWWVNVVTKYF